MINDFTPIQEVSTAERAVQNRGFLSPFDSCLQRRDYGNVLVTVTVIIVVILSCLYNCFLENCIHIDL